MEYVINSIKNLWNILESSMNSLKNNSSTYIFLKFKRRIPSLVYRHIVLWSHCKCSEKSPIIFSFSFLNYFIRILSNQFTTHFEKTGGSVFPLRVQCLFRFLKTNIFLNYILFNHFLAEFIWLYYFLFLQRLSIVKLIDFVWFISYFHHSHVLGVSLLFLNLFIRTYVILK